MEENKQEFFGSRMGRRLTDIYYGKIPARFKIFQILCCKKILKNFNDSHLILTNSRPSKILPYMVVNLLL